MTCYAIHLTPCTILYTIPCHAIQLTVAPWYGLRRSTLTSPYPIHRTPCIILYTMPCHAIQLTVVWTAVWKRSTLTSISRERHSWCFRGLSLPVCFANVHVGSIQESSVCVMLGLGGLSRFDARDTRSIYLTHAVYRGARRTRTSLRMRAARFR